MVVGMILVGVLLGGAAVWLVMRERITAAKRSRAELAVEVDALSREALRRNNAEFLELAEGQLGPLKETLAKVDEHARALESSRQHAYGALTQQVENLQKGQEDLRKETGGLVKALRTPHARGRWGEMQLRRTLEMSGMLAHCDFFEQPTAVSDGGVRRPDVVVKLAGGKNIVVDAKVPLEALLDAFDTADEAAREEHLQVFAGHIRGHMAMLSTKAYWQQFSPSPEFVVMFLGSESFYRYAIEQDPSLLELGPSQRVILASPTSLITLLFAAAAGWREETLAESARQVSELGRDLYDRLCTMGAHFAKLGNRLSQAVAAYNETVGSLETRVLPQARRFAELGVSAKDELAPVPPVDRSVKPLTSVDLNRDDSRTIEAA